MSEATGMRRPPMRAKITARLLNAAKPGAKDRFIWDTSTRGFGLKITPAGRLIYIVQDRVAGQVVRYTIGRHGAPWTPDKARDKAIALLGQMAAGINPNVEKSEARKDISVSELCTLYLAGGCSRKKESTLAVERGLIERHIKPLLGSRLVKTLRRGDIERFTTAVAAGKTAVDERTRQRGRAIVKGGKGTANRTLDLLSAILTFAEHRAVRPDNPARGVRKFRLLQRERFLTLGEITSLGDALTDAEAEFRAAGERAERGEKRKSGRKGMADPADGENPTAIAAVRLLLLTGCRKSEILSLQWQWVDFERSCLRLPDTKTGARAVPLGAAALELLSTLPRVDGSPYVFTSTKRPTPAGDGKPRFGHLIGLQKIWKRLRSRAGLGDCRLHDLRHSYASVGVAGGASLFVVGKVLGHAKARTTERYAHLADDPVKAAADKISGQIAAALSASANGGAVVPLRRDMAG